MDTSAADSAATMNAMNILQQFSQLLFLQSLAAGKSSMPFNPSMFGLPSQPQQELQQFSSTSAFSSKLPKLPPASPGNVSMQNQTIADILASHQNLKSELCSPTTSTSSTSEYSPFKMYENVNVQQPRQYKVHVNRDSAKPLQDWMNKNISDPYPSHHVVKELSKQTGFTYKQIRNWFTNSRRRFEQQCLTHSLPLPWTKKDAPKVCRKIESTQSP